jgi:DNA-binding PadR family transcriptional regulator
VTVIASGKTPGKVKTAGKMKASAEDQNPIGARPSPFKKPPLELGPNEGRGVTRAPSHRKASLEYALLGLIAEMPEASGYDIAKMFELSMEHYWYALPTQIYPTLERMEEFGLIKGREVIQHVRPNKRVYSITNAGERVMLEWLESPFEGLRLKFAPLLRCRFLGHLGADGAREILEEERRSWANKLKLYRDIEEGYFADNRGYHNVNQMFSMFTLRRGIDWMEENIRWCDWAIAEVERNRGLFPAQNTRARLKPLVPFDPEAYREMRGSVSNEPRRRSGLREVHARPAARKAKPASRE